MWFWSTGSRVGTRIIYVKLLKHLAFVILVSVRCAGQLCMLGNTCKMYLLLVRKCLFENQIFQ